MVDVRFSDAGFSATSMEVKPVSDKGKAWFAGEFGSMACGATLKKSGGYELMEHLAALGITYDVVTEGIL